MCNAYNLRHRNEAILDIARAMQLSLAELPEFPPGHRIGHQAARSHSPAPSETASLACLVRRSSVSPGAKEPPAYPLNNARSDKLTAGQQQGGTHCCQELAPPHRANPAVGWLPIAPRRMPVSSTHVSPPRPFPGATRRLSRAGGPAAWIDEACYLEGNRREPGPKWNSVANWAVLWNPRQEGPRSAPIKISSLSQNDVTI